MAHAVQPDRLREFAFATSGLVAEMYKVLECEFSFVDTYFQKKIHGLSKRAKGEYKFVAGEGCRKDMRVAVGCFNGFVEHFLFNGKKDEVGEWVKKRKEFASLVGQINLVFHSVRRFILDYLFDSVGPKAFAAAVKRVERFNAQLKHSRRLSGDFDVMIGAIDPDSVSQVQSLSQ